VTAAVLPESVLHYVQRTRESVILNDAAAKPPFAIDPYICQGHPRSILCVPLINQTKLVGVLYLENNLTPHAFKPARIAVLKVLASQAAISLENTRLYRDLQEREEAFRASEKFARGQVEALKSTMDALAMEASPDRLVEHVLRTITTQFGAHSCSVWQRVGVSNLIGFQFSFEDGRFVTKSDRVLAGITLVLPMEEFWAWPEVVRTGKPGLMEDIRELPFFSWQERLTSLGVITILIVPMSIAGRVDAAIGVRFTQKRVFSSDELELAQALANQAMLAMQLTRLSAESRESAVIAERNRMARDIHDTLAQGFTGVIMQLEAAKGATVQGNLPEAANRIERASDLARSSLGEARRSVRALRPRSLRAGKLFLALDDLLKRMAEGTNLNAEFQAEGDEGSIPSDYEEGLLRITQEALTNAVKHANARNFKATLSIAADKIQLFLVDDGRGFDPQKEHDGFGLIGMKERVDRMGGEFIIRTKQSVGTEILVVLKQQSALKPENGNE
jgi:signal transduction histidine kinase